MTDVINDKSVILEIYERIVSYCRSFYGPILYRPTAQGNNSQYIKEWLYQAQRLSRKGS